MLSCDVIRNPSLEQDVQEVLAARREFYLVNDLQEDARRQSYEPAVARLNFERRVLRLSPEEQDIAKDAFLREERRNLRTTLGERYHTSKSVTSYKTLNGQLYSPDFPDEPFTDVMERGREFCLKMHSTETKREQLEVEGFKKLQDIITNLNNPVGTKIVVFSPPGIVEGTMYPKRFIDIWEIQEDAQGKRFGQVTRFTTNFDYDKYTKGAKNIQSDYFTKWEEQNKKASVEDQIPIDAWFVGNPIQLKTAYNTIGVEALFDTFFEEDYASMQEQMFAEVMMVCWPLAEYFLEELCKGERDFRSIAESFTAILARADKFIEEREKYGESRNAHTVMREEQHAGQDMKQLVAYWSQQEVTTRVSNCGESKGFRRNKYGQIMLSYGFENPQQAMLNSVGGQSLETDEEESELITWTSGVCRLCESEDGDSSTKEVGDCNICRKHQDEFDSGKRK